VSLLTWRAASRVAGACCSTSAFNGLIQHSFALRMDDDRRPFHGHSTFERVGERFALPGRGDDVEFCVTPVGEMANEKNEEEEELAPYSPLVKHGLTTVEPQRIAFLERVGDDEYRSLPKAFSWAIYKNKERERDKEQPWSKFIFAHREASWQPTSLNDFLVEARPCNPSECEELPVSRVLCQLIAHRRSKLFGLALANHFVNVMLPYARLTPEPDNPEWRKHKSACGLAAGSWILQPLVSLIRVGLDGGDFRRMYSLTLFLIPVNDSDCGAREMPQCEIDGIVNAGWGLASSRWPSKLPPFKISGPLYDYISRLVPSILPNLLHPVREPKQQGKDPDTKTWSSLTLRQATEAIMFAVALRMAQGPTARAEMPVKRRIGDGVLTSLGSSRVSSVVVVDPRFAKATYSPGGKVFPGSFGSLMGALAGEARIALPSSMAERQKFRLDRPFVDQDDYAIGVLQSSSCLVTTVDKEKQYGRWESGLMQAGWIAYMAIGAATAIGTMRAFDRDLETMEDADPSKIAKIEGEIAVDLHEIYDLDITWDAYRSLYRLLRERLGITRDYQTLQEKMQALSRETTTRHEVKAQAQLAWLTGVIVVLTVLLLIVAIAK
jgi:hypothetical protein